MAEEESDFNSERFEEDFDTLLSCGLDSDCDLQSKNYCSRFCELVEEYSLRWQVPLPQLQVLRTALCCFAQRADRLAPNCQHVQFALSSLALSFFELLLFFGNDEFLEDPLKDIIESFQECYSKLTKYNNADLLQVKLVLKDGGPWESHVLQAILKESNQPQEEVQRYVSSEMPIFLELRIRYLLACERIREAMALSKACIEHSAEGKHLYFHQAYLTCLWKASLHERLHEEMALIDGRHAVEIICNTEREERDDLLLAFCKAFLIQQLQSGDMYYLWELVFIWSKLHLRANPSKQDFLEQCQQLMLSAKNVKSIFPFVKVIKAELGNEGLQFCVELCACALKVDLHHDPVTKALIYKTIAYLLPNDLEVCRACALLVFFLERSVESYKVVYLLYTHPDQEYQDYGPIKNHIRFETLQILKRELFFDPEFCSLIALRTNCLKLMSEKVMEEALAEIADLEESRWVPNHCVKEQPKVCVESVDHPTKRRIRKLVGMTNKPLVKRIVLPPPVAVDSPVKKRGRKPGSRVLIVADVALLRWSFRQLSMSQDTPVKGSTDKRQRHHPKQTENKTPKRRGRKPRKLQQERMALVENSTPGNTVRRGKRKRLSTKDKHLYEYAGVHMRKRKDEKPEIIWKWCSRSTLDVSFPDNEVMDICSSELEEEMPSLCQDNVIQSNTPDKSCIRAQDGSINATLSETCENPRIESHGLQPPPEVTNAISEEYFIKVDRDLVQYLHSYCIIHKEPVSKYSRFSAGVPKELLRSQDMSWSKSSELGRECTGDVQEAIPPQPPSGPGIVSPDGVEICNPGVALEAPEGDVQTTNVTNLPASTRCLSGTNFPGIKDLSSFTTTLPSSHSPNCIESRTTLTSDPERNRVLATLPSHRNSAESGRASSKLIAGSSIRFDQLSLVLHCGLCNKDFKGGNIIRHAFAHLLRDKQRCMFCGKQFQSPVTAKSHVAGHIEELKAQIGVKYAVNPLSRTSEALERGLTPLWPGDRLKSELHCKSDDKVLLKSPSLNCTVKDSKSQEEVSVALNDKAAVEKFNGAVLTGSAQGGQEEELSLVDQYASGRVAVAPVIHSEVGLQPRDACIETYRDGCKEGKMILSATASEKVYANGHSEDRMAIQAVSTHGESRAVSPSEEFTKVSWVDRFTVGVTDSLEAIGDGDTKAKDQLVGVGLFRRSCIPLPPSSYLDERYTSMPKRRKPTPINHDLPTPQRCPSCFSSFSSEEELKRHRSLDSCASLFGFDSDDEGKSDWA